MKNLNSKRNFTFFQFILITITLLGLINSNNFEENLDNLKEEDNKFNKLEVFNQIQGHKISTSYILLIKFI